MPRMNGGEALVRSLAAEGLRAVFGVPGAGQYEAIDALYSTPSVRYIAVRHEQAASYMADGYARASGEVAAALVVEGPGLFQCHVRNRHRFCYVLAGTGGYGGSSPPQKGAGPRRDGMAWTSDKMGWPRPASGRDSRHRAGGVPAATFGAAAPSGNRGSAGRIRGNRGRKLGAAVSWFTCARRWRPARDSTGCGFAHVGAAAGHLGRRWRHARPGRHTCGRTGRLSSDSGRNDETRERKHI